jgi:hypothetical protein
MAIFTHPLEKLDVANVIGSGRQLTAEFIEGGLNLAKAEILAK